MHLHHLIKQDVKIKLRALAQFRMDIPRIYIVGFESVMMLFLRTFRMNGSIHKNCSASVFELVKKATPSTLPEIPWTWNDGLNNACRLGSLAGSLMEAGTVSVASVPQMIVWRMAKLKDHL